MRYCKGEENVFSDALSRVYKDGQDGDGKKERNLRRATAQRDGKLKKHLLKNYGTDVWRFDDGREAVVPKEEDRESLIMDTHIELEHSMVGQFITN